MSKESDVLNIRVTSKGLPSERIVEIGIPEAVCELAQGHSWESPDGRVYILRKLYRTSISVGSDWDPTGNLLEIGQDEIGNKLAVDGASREVLFLNHEIDDSRPFFIAYESLDKFLEEIKKAKKVVAKTTRLDAIRDAAKVIGAQELRAKLSNIDPDVMDKEVGMTPLKYFSMKGDVSIVSILADNKERKLIALEIAAKNNKISLVKHLVNDAELSGIKKSEADRVMKFPAAMGYKEVTEEIRRLRVM